MIGISTFQGIVNIGQNTNGTSVIDAYDSFAFLAVIQHQTELQLVHQERFQLVILAHHIN